MKTLATRRRHRAAAPILVLLTLALIGVLYAAVGSATTAQAKNDGTSANAELIKKGGQLFAEGCSSCHGLGAQGGPEAPTLIGVGSAAVDFQVSTGRMPLAAANAQAPQKPVIYTDEQIAALAAFVASLAPGPALPANEEINKYVDADLAQGGELFRTNCSQCHNFTGAGGALSNGAFAPDLRNATPREIYGAMLTGPANMPGFSDATLTPENKLEIIRYIQQMDSQPDYGGWDTGSLGPVTEGLFTWIIGIGLMIGAAVWIGARVR